MHNRLLLFSLLLLFSGLVPGQILKVRLRDSKIERRYKASLSRIGGAYFIVGEPKAGLVIKPGSINIVQKSIELWVLDPRHPDRLPYKMGKKGELQPTSKRSFVVIPRSDLAGSHPVSFLMEDQTLPGIAGEYRLRSDEIAAIRKKIKKTKKATQEWFRLQRHLLDRMERFRLWLEALSFEKPARKMAADIAKETKRLKDDGYRERAQSALESIHPIPVPEDLDETAREISGTEYKAFESQHVRLLFPAGAMEPGTAKSLLKLGENIIEGFRREFCDPYAPQRDDDGIEDEIPDGVFAVFLWVPDSAKAYERYYTDYLGGSWGTGERKKRHLQARGTSVRGLHGFPYLHYWRLGEQNDFEGQVAHGLGHDLMQIQFCRGAPGSREDWMREGVAYYTSFEYLGRNTVTCIAFKMKTYDRTPGPEGKKTVAEGRRAAFNELALSKGPPLHRLVSMDLADMEDPDLAKGWSFFDFVARTLGKKGVLWLRAACFEAGKTDGFVERLRARTKEIFGLKEGDALGWLDSQWRAYAKSSQNKGEAPRRRR
ncbi:MAG TPA: hypothetical protein ENK43_16850 [Planctomycetes bacterium]|nr:hypothetical protein [Planctomycetota bacterium]